MTSQNFRPKRLPLPLQKLIRPRLPGAKRKLLGLTPQKLYYLTFFSKLKVNQGKKMLSLKISLPYSPALFHFFPFQLCGLLTYFFCFCWMKQKLKSLVRPRFRLFLLKFFIIFVISKTRKFKWKNLVLVWNFISWTTFR
jgi:hypothetical protein